MSGKDVDISNLIVSALLSLLSMNLATSAVGGAVYILSAMFATPAFLMFTADGVFHSPGRRLIAFRLLLCSLLVFMAARIKVLTQVNLCFLEEQVVRLEGRVVFDSSFSQKGNHIMRIMLTGCRTLGGDQGTATGLVSAIGGERSLVSYGTLVRLDGHFSDGLFIYDELMVSGRGYLGYIRERIIPFLEYRLTSEGDEPSVLSAMLLFGRSDYASSSLRELAQGCGCSHILALSGMHLGILASVGRRLLGRGWAGKVLSSVLVAAFVFIAGPRPSLVRAALTFTLGPGRTFLVFALQMLLFPATMVEMGCCYGYVAVFAIGYLSPYIQAVLFQVLGRGSKTFSSTLSVLIFSVPLYMVTSGRWYPAVLLASPIAASLAAASMVIGILMLLFGRIGILLKVNSLIYAIFEKILIFFGRFPSFGWIGFLVLLALILLIVLSLALARNRIGRTVRLTRATH